jgi:hypothetical protein
MRTLFLALVTSATIFVTGVTDVAASDHRYCIQGDDFAGTGDCSFASYQQCQATASGRTAYCGANLRLPNVVLTDRTRLRHRLWR